MGEDRIAVNFLRAEVSVSARFYCNKIYCQVAGYSDMFWSLVLDAFV